MQCINIPASFCRFAAGKCYNVTVNGKFKAHVQAQFLSPEITYTVNLVMKHSVEVLHTRPRLLGIRYKLEGEKKCSISCLADVREDGWLVAELFQFESQRRNFDLEISFEGFMYWDCFDYYLLQGIDFQPIEKVEHEVLMDDMQTISESDDTYWENKLPNDYDDVIKWSKDDWFFLAKSGKRCVMLPARSSLLEKQWNWMHQSESRFGEVAFNPTQRCSIVCKIKSQILSPETTYACYLVYKLPPEKTSGSIEFPLKVRMQIFMMKVIGKISIISGLSIYLVLKSQLLEQGLIRSRTTL
ncbi:putative phloem protein [Helianthus annuus]|nr:putative phloem protein [Helianthus annuus]